MASTDAGTGTESREGTQPEATASKAADRTFSQSDVDRLVGERVAKAERAWTKKLEQAQTAAREEAVAAYREEHGLDDDVLAKIGQAPDRDKELRTLKGELTKAQKRAEEADKRAQALRAKMRETLVEGALVRAAAPKAVHPDDVVAHLRGMLEFDETSLEVYVRGDDGNRADTTIDQLVDALLVKKRHLARATGIAGAGSMAGSPTSSKGNGGGPDLSTKEGRMAHLAAHEGLLSTRRRQ